MSSDTSSSGGGGRGVGTLGLIGAGLGGWIAYLKGHTIGTIIICAVLSWLYVCASCAGCDGGIPDGAGCNDRPNTVDEVTP